DLTLDGVLLGLTLERQRERRALVRPVDLEGQLISLERDVLGGDLRLDELGQCPFKLAAVPGEHEDRGVLIPVRCGAVQFPGADKLTRIEVRSRPWDSEDHSHPGPQEPAREAAECPCCTATHRHTSFTSGEPHGIRAPGTIPRTLTRP